MVFYWQHTENEARTRATNWKFSGCWYKIASIGTDMLNNLKISVECSRNNFQCEVYLLSFFPDAK